MKENGSKQFYVLVADVFLFNIFMVNYHLF